MAEGNILRKQKDNPRSIVQLRYIQKIKQCGYCKSYKPSNLFGIWAHSLRVQDYNLLLYRGWTGVGRYLYTTIFNYYPVCCSRYTIACHALHFQLSKSQRRILHKFNHYFSLHPKNRTNFQDTTKTDSKPEKSEENQSVKKLEDFLILDFRKNPGRKLRIKTLRVDQKTIDVKNFETEYALYREHQIEIQGKSEWECGRDNFIRYYCDSPFVSDKDEDGKDTIYGRYHELYYINRKLIAISVIDILPSCVSFVNFFYSKSYSFLSLGHYNSLRNIGLVRRLNRSHPEIRDYIMGSFIPKCGRTHYKLKYSSSSLLCPILFTWHPPDEELRRWVTASGVVCKLNSDHTVPFDYVDTEPLKVVHRGGRIISYAAYQEQVEQARELLTHHYEIQFYAYLVGSVCVGSIIILPDGTEYP